LAAILCLAGPGGRPQRELTNRLAGELQSQGLRVGIMVSGQDQPEDSVAELALSGRSMVLKRRLPRAMDLEELAALYLDDLDLVITEIHHQAKRPKIEYRPAGADPVLDGDPGLRAIVSEQAGPDDPPRFSPDDIVGLAEFVRQGLPAGRKPAKVRMLVGGRRVPAKGFIQDLVAGTMRALVGSLKGGDRPGPMIIFIE